MSKHARLSASSAHRWMNCTPSVKLEEQFDEETSVYAEEGTAAHELSEYKIKKFLGKRVRKPKSEYQNDEMDEYTNEYVNFVTEQIEKAKNITKDAVILVEQKVDFSEYVEGGFGTADLLIVYENNIQIIDFKYGQGVVVCAEDNPQMKLYALGALNLFDALYDIKKVTVSIVQPRLQSISTAEITIEDLLFWANGELKEKAEIAFAGEGEFMPGQYCRFCRAKALCRARADYLMDIAKHEFSKPELLTDEEISEVLQKADALSRWANEIYAYAQNEAITKGKHWLNFKLVEGRSNRKYSSEEEVADTAKKAGFEDIYKHSLIGISDMEKLMGKKKFKEILGALVYKPQGKITLVPQNDKREEVNITTAEADFKEED